MFQNQIDEILKKYKVIAVVGLSREPSKDSYKVSDYLKKKNYRIIPVNPFANEVLHERSYPSLLDIPKELSKTIEIVDIFRRSEDVPQVVEQAIKLKSQYGNPFVIWMQLGIINEQAAEMARSAGFVVIMDKCLMAEHQQIHRLLY